MCYSTKSKREIDPVEAHLQIEAARLREENATLKKWIRDGREVPRCCVCGKPIVNVSIQRLLRTFLWDCRECFRKRPGKIMELEQSYGMDIVDVLKLTTRKYKNINAQCQALDVSIPYLYSIIKKYCNKDYTEFFAENSVGRRRETYVKKLKKRKRKKHKKYPPQG